MSILTPRSPDNCIDVSFHAVRMGLMFPVHIDVTVYRAFLAKAAKPDTDTFLLIDAMCESIDAAATREEDEASFPFHYVSKRKGFQPEDVRLYVTMYTDPEKEGAPWLRISSDRPLIDHESKPSVSVD